MQPLPPPPKTKGRFIVELESARGFAAFLVAGVHCAHTPILINGTTTELRQVVETGWFWKLLHWLHEELVLGHYELHRSVVFFFVLSGFLLTASLQEGPTAVGRAAVRFSIGRFFRIYPAIVAAIFVFWMAYEIAGLSLLPGAFTADSIVRNLLLLRTNIDGVMWTLQVEVVALPLIFGAFILMPRLGLVPVTITAIALFGLSFWGAWDRLNLTGSKQLFPFMIGIAGFHLGPRLFSGLTQRRANILFLVTVFLFFTVSIFIHKQWSMLTRSFVAAAMIGILSFAPQFPAAALLRTLPLRFLGRVSYSFYLLHPLTLTVVFSRQAMFGAWIERGIPAIAISTGLWIATAAFILPFAALMYRTVEFPSIQLGKRIWKRASS